MSASRSVCDNKAVVYLLSVVAIVLWGMSYIWSDKLIALDVPIFYFVPIRILVAGLILLVFNILTKEFRFIARKDLLKFAFLALFEPLIYFLTETYGIKETGSPTISAMIIASVPIFSVAAGALFFKEKVSVLNALGIAVTLGGICMVLLKQGCNENVSPNFVLGIILLMLAVFSEVGHASLTKLLADGYKPQVIVMYQFLIGSVYFLPFFLTKGIESFDARTRFLGSPGTYSGSFCSLLQPCLLALGDGYQEARSRQVQCLPCHDVRRHSFDRRDHRPRAPHHPSVDRSFRCRSRHRPFPVLLLMQTQGIA